MAAFCDPMTERFLCSICLDVFNDPVCTPCGHNFCKTCLKTYWDTNQYFICPNCKERFSERPDLKINTTLRDLVNEHKKKAHEKQAVVMCDICDEGKLEAVKSCLVCQSSYCQTHLEPHLRVTGLQKHKLIDPVNNLQDYICQKHERPLELICRDDQTCVCLICTVTDHKYHDTVPLEESELLEMMGENQKAAEKHDKELIKEMEQEITELKRRNTELEMMEKKQKAAEKQSQDIIKDLKKRNTELEMMEQNQKAAEKQSEDVIKDLKKRNTELEMTISHMENNLHLQQEKHQQELRQQQKSLSWIIVVIGGSILFACFVVDHNIMQRNDAAEWKCMKQSAVDVTLDPDTAHPNLILSDDQKQVRHGDTEQYYLFYSQRFYNYFNVLGKEGFSSGRFYYEVQVEGKTDWVLGVVRESVKRTGEIPWTPVNGYWTVRMMNGNEYLARAGPDVSLSLNVNPQKVGVFVDYNEGLVSFYDVDSRSHIYSFTGQTFTEKLYPVFNPCNNEKGTNSAPLIITPVNYNE